MKRSQRGYTLVELLLALAIVSVLSTIVSISFPAIVTRYQLQEASSELAGAIREAELRAYRQNRYWRVVVSANELGGGDYSVEYCGTTPISGDCPSDQWVLWRRGSIRNRILVTGSVTGALTFSPTGAATWGFPTVTAVSDYTSNAARLVDGQVVDTTQEYDPLYNSRVISWDIPETAAAPYQIDITVQLPQPRFIPSVRIGLFAWQDAELEYPSPLVYPDRIAVTGLNCTDRNNQPTAPSQEISVQQAATTGVERKWETVPVDPNSRCESLTVSLIRAQKDPSEPAVPVYFAIDEVDMSKLFFTFTKGSQSQTFLISPVTGSITVGNS